MSKKQILIVSEQANAAAIGPMYMDPIKSLFPASQAEVTILYNNDKNNTPPYPNYYLSYPSAAPSGIASGDLLRHRVSPHHAARRPNGALLLRFPFGDGI